MRILIVGVGYVGRALALLCAKDHETAIFDLDIKKSQAIQALNPSIRILGNIVKREDERFDFALVCVPTDFDENTHRFDTSKVDGVVKQLAASSLATCIVIKSTLPVGHTSYLQNCYPARAILFSPEFLRETKAYEDCLHPSRIIVGYNSINEDAKECARIFAKLLLNCSEEKDCPVLITGLEEAESIKLFANTYLALRVAYFNELDTYALFHGLNAKDIVDGVCADPRIGQDYNNPSFGYGGYCLPKDSKELLHGFDAIPQTLIGAIVGSNQTRKEAIASAIIAKASELPKGSLIGIYRLTMKKGSDNFRQSAILDVMAKLKDAKLNLLIYEPNLEGDSFDGIPLCASLEKFKSACSLIVANRVDENIADVEGKVFTRDLFFRD